MRKFGLIDDRFSGAYTFFCTAWLLIGFFDLIIFEIPSLFSSQSAGAWIGVAAALMFVAAGVLMLRGLKLGVAMVVLALVTESVKLYVTDGWSGFTFRVLSSILCVAILLVVSLYQKKDGRTAWSLLK